MQERKEAAEDLVTSATSNTGIAPSNKCITTSNKCITTSNKTLLVPRASLPVASALQVASLSS